MDKKKYKINLINFNRISNSKFEPSTNDRIIKFKKSLSNHGFVVTLRKTRGDDTNSACGQLSGDFMNKIKLQNKTSIYLMGSITNIGVTLKTARESFNKSLLIYQN